MRDKKIYFQCFLRAVSIFTLIAPSGCGNKKKLKPRPSRAPQSLGGQAEQRGKEAPKCGQGGECSKVRLSLTGTSSFGGQATNLMTWDVGALAPDAQERKIVVFAVSGISAMDIISKTAEPVMRLNWKPETAQEGMLKFQVRDVTRCQSLAAGKIDCEKDFQLPDSRFDEEIEAPFQIVESTAVFDSSNSDFFKQFHCKEEGWKEEVANVLTEGSARDRVRVITEYLVNGEPKPTPYECLQRNAAGK